ncbi:MAG: hypothetical protein LQ343_005375 [Gyalolechia ehrenbergii]|nr:MAG: hypothetical protein LQ343_005375 [Gyalolechia ehrenbergii]
MSTDKSLATILRALQSVSGEQDSSRLLESATNLFVLLSNPSNVSLLASQILSAPAIWSSADHVETVVRVIKLFTSASIRRLQRQTNLQAPVISFSQKVLSGDDWIIAVIKGVDRGIPQSRQLLALAGLLQGCESQGRHGISTALHTKLQSLLINKTNLSLRDVSQRSSITDPGLVIAISLIFDVLDRQARVSLDHDLLLPMLISLVFFSDIGLRQGYFLSTIDTDIIEGVEKKFNWSTKSPSYRQLQFVASGPLMAALGRLARLAAFSIGQIDDMTILPRMLQDLSEFSRSLSIQWRQNKLSEIDVSEEMVFLSDETLRTPLPLLWRVLRTSMFAIIVMLTACMGRFLSDDFKGKCDVPSSATLVLRILRNVCFISSRLGTDTLSQYSFVYLAAIDILAQCPRQAEQFVKEIQPTEIGKTPQHPLDRSMDLYFLNTAERFTPVLDSNIAIKLLTPAAAPYLRMDGDTRLLQLFEAAHCIMLAVLAAPQNSDIAAAEIEPYAGFLFQASSQPLPRSPSAEETGDGEPVSEQAVLGLALIDSLPFLSLDALEDWLPIAVRSIRLIQGPAIQHAVKQRFWEVLSNGEMDVDRAALCVTWWGTRGGREILFYGRDDVSDAPLMSGALNESSKL